MQNTSEFSETELQHALYDICSEDSAAELKERGFNYISRFSGNKEMLLALLTFVINEEEDRSVQKFAATCLVRFIECKNILIRPMMYIFLTNMKVPEKRSSMKKAFNLFIEIIADAIHEPNPDYLQFLAHLMLIYLNAENEPQLHELGAMMLHAILKNLTIPKMLHAKFVAEGMQILLSKCRCALKNNSEKSYVLFFHALMSATILGHHMSRISIVLQPFRNSLEDILNLLKFIAAYGTRNHFNEVSELLKILLKHKQLSGTKWLRILKACEEICRSKEYQDFARISTLKIFGNVVSLRRVYFQRKKIFHGILITLIDILGQEAVYKASEPFEQRIEQLPTPLSSAADLLQFISHKFPKEDVTDSFVKILLATVRSRALSEWQFRGIFISLARIVKSCGQCLNARYVKELIGFFRCGFIDISIHVRQAANYALQKFFNYFYDECSCWVVRIFPAFLKHMNYLVSDYEAGCLQQQPLQVERLFGTLKIFCDILSKQLIDHFPVLMCIFQEILQHIKHARIIVLTLELLEEIVCQTGTEFLPYFNELALTFKPFLISWELTEYDEVRACIVELLLQLMLVDSDEFMQVHGYVIIELVFSLLQIQHMRTQNDDGADLELLLKYSPLRCSIFRFFGELSCIRAETIESYMPQLLGTLVGTVTAIKFLSKEELQQIGITRRRLEFVYNADLDSDQLKAATYFKLSDNDEVEITRFTIIQESFTLYEEIFIAFFALQNLMENCAIMLQPHNEFTFTQLVGVLKYPYIKLRKQLLYTLNHMLDGFLEDFQFSDGHFLDRSIIEIVSLLQMETDFTIIGECVRAFLTYVAINEKYLEAHVVTYVYLMNMMTEIFNTVIILPQKGLFRQKKDNLLSEIIAFVPKLLGLRTPSRFYFGIFLYIFEAKINMPLYRSPISDRNRADLFEKLIEGLHLMEKNDLNNFKRISYLFIKGLKDPLNLARENAAAGLGMLVDRCDPQPVDLYKNILYNLWKCSKREKCSVVLDCIWYAMTLTVKRSIWQLPIQKVSVKLVSLLPIRDIFEYNMIMVDFYDYIFYNRPEGILPIIRIIYKYLLDILESVVETDIDPLYKRALALASKLYSMHIEELQQITIKPFIMEALLCAYSNKNCLKTVLRLEG